MYEPLETIGHGSFGIIRKVKRISDGKILAQKEIDYGQMSQLEKQQLVNEVNILQELKHPNIVSYYERILDTFSSKLYIITEYCEGGDLATLIAKCKEKSIYLPEDTIWSILTQLLLALHTCHFGSKRNHATILHRDVKPENGNLLPLKQVFLDKRMNAKLGDFGLCKVVESPSVLKRTFVGTPFYMSPELMASSGYNTKSDIWALGCVIYEMMALHPPFNANSAKELALKIQLGNPPDLPTFFSSELKNIIRSMLTLDASKRPDTNDLLTHKRITIIAKERELLRFHSELMAKENELKRWKEELAAENQLLQNKRNELDFREKKIKLLEKDLSEPSGMMNFLMIGSSIRESKGESFSPSQLRKILNTKSFSLLNKKITH